MSNRSQVSGHVLRSGRLIPNRTRQPVAALPPQDSLQAQDSVPPMPPPAENGIPVQPQRVEPSLPVPFTYAESAVSSRASRASAIRRKKLAAELKAKEEIAKLERDLILQRLAVEQARLDELDEMECPDYSAENDNTQKGLERVHEWLNYKPEPTTGAIPYEPDPAQVPMPPTLPQPQSDRNDVQQLLARQSVPKELPIFHGDAQEWPTFIAQYKRSTTVCGFSNDENLLRLHRCLKGKAKDTVAALLTLPENVPVIISSLERRFGRPDIIIGEMIQRIMSLPSVREDKPETIIDLSNTVMGLVSTVKSLGQTGHLTNPQLVQQLVSLLTPSLRLQWGAIAAQSQSDVSRFSSWLLTIADAASYIPVTHMKKEHTREEKPMHMRPHRREHVLATTTTRKGCGICGEKNHYSQSCPRFQAADPPTRWQMVKRNSLCFKCLGSSHSVRECPSHIKCNKDGCERPHHPMLHESRNSTPPQSTAGNTGAVFSHSLYPTSQVLLRILPVTLYGPRGRYETYALFDEASTVTLLCQSAADAIGATGEKEPLRLQWTSNQTQSSSHSMRVDIGIEGTNGKRYSLSGVRTVENLALPLQSVNGANMQKRWPYLRNYPVPTISAAQPTILLGQDNCHLIIARQVVEGGPNAPVLSETKLGWILHGNVPLMKRVDAEFSFLCCQSADSTLHDLVKHSFTTESFGIKLPAKPVMGKGEERAMQLLQQTTRRVGARFEAGLLWKNDAPMFPPSYATALHRLKCMEKKMDRDSNFAAQYCQKIDEYVKKGYAVKLSQMELQQRPTKWFLPHFAVTNENKPGKIRFVFDAAAKSNGVSLNDLLLSGPDLLVPLPYVLFKFRTHEIAICGDIKEMFHQVLIRKEDCPAQRFLWRGMDRSQPPSVYEMRAMTFGATSSPTTAQYVKNANASEMRESEPDAYAAITNKHYVDDYLDSASTHAEAIARAAAVIRVHKQGGFEIRNWTSNSQTVLQSIPSELRAIPNESLTVGEKLPCERVLGIKWDPNHDHFLFAAKPQTEGGRMPNTKRSILRVVMSLYDPLGFLVNFTVRAKILLQDIWRSGIGWDDEVAGPTMQKWTEWMKQFNQIINVTVPRPYCKEMRTRESTQLHVFCDASEQAFAAVAYLRICLPNHIDVAFVMGRSRVAPLKPMSIPRLELQAAVMAARLACSIREGHDMTINETHFWSDSRTVLCWLRSDGRKFKQFVSHRVGEILECTEVENWHWVPTAENVADDATRDTDNALLTTDSRWLKGPKFLHLPKKDWPAEPVASAIQPTEEMKKEFVAVCTTPTDDSLPNIHRFSSWHRLIRTTARVRKFVQLCRKIEKEAEPLTTHDCNDAEARWIRECQRSSFPTDVAYLLKGHPVDSHSRILPLNPFMDTDGIIRANGRLRSPTLTYDAQFPIILCPKHPYTKLLIMDYHVQVNHRGQETAHNNLRQRFWILDGRAAVKSAWNSCNYCRIQRAKPSQPQMGLLPECRLGVGERPFTNVGVDYFGPMLVTVRRRTEKRYAVIFTCLTIRAVHVELATNLSTDVCVMAIRRFMSRRGQPKSFHSDNGRNFRGASGELSSAFKELNQHKLCDWLSIRNIEWHFSPPSTPHMGGCWERLIRSVKSSLRTVLRERAPKEEVLATLLLEVESILNSRPLTHVSVDLHDTEPLTPNHFLLGRSKSQPTYPLVASVLSSAGRLRRMWRTSQSLADYFWQRWIREYAPTLTKRTKWFTPTKPLAVDELVLIVDENMPRGCWLRGKVTATYPGTDGQVRVVDVKTVLGTYRRPVNKLALLELSGDKE